MGNESMERRVTYEEWRNLLDVDPETSGQELKA